MLVFDWSKKNTILDQVRKILTTKEWQQKIKRMDFLFDVATFFILCFHLFLTFYGIYYEILPAWVFVILFTMTRTGLAAAGHYHNHRKKDGFADWADGFFDMQYVGASTIAFDGHSIIHHAQTNSPADLKRTVFTGITELPRIWRLPAQTI
jgi:hypothetical protein